MIEAVLVVFTKAVAGRDDDLNDWYTNIHVRDALRFRGSIAAQRFSLSGQQVEPVPVDFGWRYLALYDVFDARRFSLEHWENALTPRMKVTDAFDDTILEDYHYYPMQFRNDNPEEMHAGGVIIEQMNAVDGNDDAFRNWYRDVHFPVAAGRPDVHSAAFLVYRAFGQMLPTTPVHNYVAIYRMKTFDDLDAWPHPAHAVDAPIARRSTRVTCWDPIGQRITIDDVRHTTAAALAEEERARARMGDRLLSEGREKLDVR